MTHAKHIVAMVGLLLAGSSAGVLVMGGTSGAHGEKVLTAVQGPEFADQSLKAEISAATGSDNRQSGSEVHVAGAMHGVKVDEVVFCSQESANMLRLGWESADHLVISVPQFSQDAGKAAGEGDPSFLCRSQTKAVRVSCDTYPVGARSR